MKAGDDIEATVVKYKPNGEYVIEPVHPYYRIGQSYPFRYVKLDRTIDVFGRTEAVITVEDVYNQSIKVKPLTWQIEAESYHPENIDCLVHRFKRGKPVLVNVEETVDQDNR
jgi:hypothetical protein